MIKFRTIEESDLGMLKKWRNSENVRPFVREYRLLSDVDQKAWFDSYLEKRRGSDWDEELMILQVHENYDPGESLIDIGVGGFTRIQWRNRRAELSLYLANSDYDGRGILIQALRALILKGFQEFGFHKITWPVYGHDPKIAIYKEVMQEEAVLADEYWWDGAFRPRHYLSILNPG